MEYLQYLNVLFVEILNWKSEFYSDQPTGEAFECFFFRVLNENLNYGSNLYVFQYLILSIFIEILMD